MEYVCAVVYVCDVIVYMYVSGMLYVCVWHGIHVHSYDIYVWICIVSCVYV